MELEGLPDMRVRAGERVTRLVEVSVGGRTTIVPIIAVSGSQPGPRVAITGGIHGAEYVGIEAAQRLGMGIGPAHLSGSLVIVPIANTAAFQARAIYTSGLDTHNLNRMFPGDPDGSPSQRLAAWLFEHIIRPSDFYIDLHGGDMIEALVPFVIYLGSDGERVETVSREMAEATGIPRIIRSLTPGSTYGAASSAGIPAILAEIGGQGVWTEEEVEQHMAGVLRVLQYLKVLPGEPSPLAHQPRHYDTFAWVRAEAGGLFQPAVSVGDSVEAGQTLGRITDYFGEELQWIEAPQAGEVVFLVTALAMNAGDPILAIGA